MRPLARAFALVGIGLAAACLGPLDPPPPRAGEQFTGERALVDLDALAQLRAEAEAAPDQLAPQWRAGMAHVRASLEGHVELRDHAERYLERAWQLDPAGAEVPAARVLARYLNMRSSVLDLSKVELQIELYASLLADDTLARDPAALAAEQFHFASFHAAAVALRRYGEGQPLVALREVAALERAMAERLAAHPDDIDSATMAGNFALTFAGVIPVGGRARLAAGIDYLGVQQDRWDQLSPRARSQSIAPNVHSVFALFLAEALLARGDTDEAGRRYQALIDLPGQPDTGPRRQIVALAEHRLAHLDAYAGAAELLPPWPAGVTGCVACHSQAASLPTDDLYLLSDLPDLR